jgi:hypothetical protein
VDPWTTFLNHGAFGGAMKPQLEASERWRTLCEVQPLRFYDRELFPMMAYSLQLAARHFNCPANELYPLQNVTTGLNCVLHSLHLSPGDEVVHLSLTYGSTKKMLQDVCQRSGATLRVVHLPLPIPEEESILQKFSAALGDRTRLVIIDQITSNTALVLPTLKMARLARQAGALVVVDAAHAMMSTAVSIYPANSKVNLEVGQSAINGKPADMSGRSLSVGDNRSGSDDTLSDVADVWLTNAHKWFCAPKGCAFMWVRPDVAVHLRPPVVSHGFQGREMTWITADRIVKWWHERKEEPGIPRPVAAGDRQDQQGPLQMRLLSALAWDGCRDYASLLSIPVGMEIWASLGYNVAAGATGKSAVSPTTIPEVPTNEWLDDAVHVGMARSRAYMRDLLHDQVVPMLVQEWGLQERDFAGPGSMRQESPMVLVSLSAKERVVCPFCTCFT